MRLKSLLLVSVAVLPVAIAGCADSASEIRARYGKASWTAEELTSTPYDRARQHFTAGRFGLAVKQFEIAVSRDPDSVEALNGLAASFDQLQRFELAERYYLRALNLDPGNTQTLNNLGYSYLMQRRYDLALAYLKDALALDPMNEMVQDNLQQAQASLELETRDFLASAVGSAEFGDVAAAPRTVNLHSQKDAVAAPSGRDVPSAVHIQTLANSDAIWVERSSPVVQSLITQPNPDLLTAMRDAGLAPRIANFRNQVAVTALQTEPAPWQAANLMIAEPMVEGQLNGAIRQDQLVEDLLNTPVAAPTVAVDIATLPQLSATVIEEAPALALSDLPQLSAAVIDPDVLSDAREVFHASVTAGDGSADGTLGDLPVLSAVVMEAADSPAKGEVPPVRIESPAIRQVAAVGYEAFLHRTDMPRRDDPPALPPGTDESPVIEVSNGTGRSQMAFRIGEFLGSEGLSVNRLTNAEHFSHQETVIFYRREWLRKAQELAACLPIEVTLVAVPNQASDIRIRLGGDLLNFDQGLFYASRESSAKPTG
jgi:Tetratricopeptide repeat/LytR cell envelope-related transcriptional attenuator